MKYATLLAGLLAVVLLVPGVGPDARDNSGYADFEHRIAQRRWLQKSMHETEVQMRLGRPDRIDSYGLVSFWRYPGARTVIFDSSGRVIGWENF